MYILLKKYNIYLKIFYLKIFSKRNILCICLENNVSNNDFILLLSKIFKYSNKQQILNNYLYQHFMNNLNKKEFMVKQSNHKKMDYGDNYLISPKNRYLLYILSLYFNFDIVVLKEQYLNP